MGNSQSSLPPPSTPSSSSKSAFSLPVQSSSPLSMLQYSPKQKWLDTASGYATPSTTASSVPAPLTNRTGLRGFPSPWWKPFEANNTLEPSLPSTSAPIPEEPKVATYLKPAEDIPPPGPGEEVIHLPEDFDVSKMYGQRSSPNDAESLRDRFTAKDSIFEDTKDKISKHDFGWKYYERVYEEGSEDLPEDPLFPVVAMLDILKTTGDNEINEKLTNNSCRVARGEHDNNANGEFYTTYCYPNTNTPKLWVGSYKRVNAHDCTFDDYFNSCDENFDTRSLYYGGSSYYNPSRRSTIQSVSSSERGIGYYHNGSLPFKPKQRTAPTKSEVDEYRRSVRSKISEQLKVAGGQVHAEENFVNTMISPATTKVFNETGVLQFM